MKCPYTGEPWKYSQTTNLEQREKFYCPGKATKTTKRKQVAPVFPVTLTPLTYKTNMFSQ